MMLVGKRTQFFSLLYFCITLDNTRTGIMLLFSFKNVSLFIIIKFFKVGIYNSLFTIADSNQLNQTNKGNTCDDIKKISIFTSVYCL